MKLSLVLAICLAVVSAEPPVGNYLPPNRGASRPSSNYGAPSSSFSAPSAPSSNYGAPSAPSSNYGAPSSNYGAPSSAAPSSNYGAPHSGQTQAVFGGRPSSNYGAPSSRPSSNYGAPSPSSNYGAPSPSSNYGAPSPSSNYGAPSPSSNYGAPSNQYLPANSGYSGGRGGGHGEDEYNEPANYNFEYMVKDEQSGNDFGHKESRQGDRTEGEYYVLLPDGRKQIVRYEADEKGYRPKITYEDVGTGGGYGRGPASGGYSNGGYPSGGPY